MNSAFNLTARSFNNAVNFEVREHRLQKFEPVDKIISETRRWFITLEDEDTQETAQAIRISVWKLKATVLLSLLPFDHPELALVNQIHHLHDVIIGFPQLYEMINRLEMIIEFLINNPYNPKREKVVSLLQESYNSRMAGNDIGLITKITRGTMPGWNQVLYNDLLEIRPQLYLIGSRNDLYDRTYYQLILPCGGGYCSFIKDLYYGYRTRFIDVITYRKEGVYYPARIELPKTTILKRASIRVSKPEMDDDQKEDMVIGERIEREYWEFMRQSAERISSSNSSARPTDIIVKARLTLLPNNRMVYLINDKKELIGSRPTFDDEEEGFGYRPVSQLKEGDYIVLRTSGGGDMVREMADLLIETEGKIGLREKAFDWKDMLREVLSEYGTEYVALDLIQRNVNLSYYQYVKLWATDLVLRPKPRKRFEVLIHTIKDYGADLKGENLEDFITTRWTYMDEIEGYHRRAGFKIRKVLLKSLKARLRDEEQIGEEYHLSIPELGTAEISVFKVFEVDSKVIEIPFSQAGVIMEEKRQISWLG